MSTKRAVQYWVIPPETHMEDDLDVYSHPYDANIPVLCMDEQPVQLVDEVQRPIEATREHPRRVDYEYKLAGVANIFMFAEPLAGWRHVAVRDRKTKVDWAIEMAGLLDGRYADYVLPASVKTSGRRGHRRLGLVREWTTREQIAPFGQLQFRLRTRQEWPGSENPLQRAGRFME